LIQKASASRVVSEVTNFGDN